MKFNEKLKQMSQKMLGSLDYSDANPVIKTQGFKSKLESLWKSLSVVPKKTWNSFKYHCKMMYLIPLGFISERCCKKRMPSSFFKKTQ